MMAEASHLVGAGQERHVAISIRCDRSIERRARYVFDSLFLAAGWAVDYVEELPPSGICLLYAEAGELARRRTHVLAVAHDPMAWRTFTGGRLPDEATSIDGVPVVLPPRAPPLSKGSGIAFDLAANAFYFLSSWAERRRGPDRESRQLYSHSEFARLGVPQDIVDRYLRLLLDRLHEAVPRHGTALGMRDLWPDGKSFAIVLSHDVDFLPVTFLDSARQAVKTIARHVLTHRSPADAWHAGAGWLAATLEGRDPYGCVPEIIKRETELGVRSSFQVAVARRHPNDVNYRIEDDRVRNYLRTIVDAGFDLCLHGSYRSTEDAAWYVEEARTLEARLKRPLGSRQHFLSFDYDTLFLAEETAGIQYDMSIGYPDQTGPRAGFSYPFFPYNLAEDRPYAVLEISLFVMDVTLRGYLNLGPRQAEAVVRRLLSELRDVRGCASVVWHPIVFGGARDPGYDELYFGMVRAIQEMGGVATDGRAINDLWRSRARAYSSFS